MKELRYLNKFFLKYKKNLLLGVFFITLTVIFQIVAPQMVRKSMDLIADYFQLMNQQTDVEITADQKSEFNVRLLQYAGILLLAALLKGLFLFFTRQTIIIMSRNIEFDLKNEVYRHYQTLPLSFYRKNKTGDLMARISEDVGKVRMYLGPALMYGINLVVLFSITIAYMVSVNPRLTFYVLLPLPILSFSIYKVSDKMNKQSTKIQTSLSALTSFVQEAFSGIRVLKAFVREEDSLNGLTTESKLYKKEQLKLAGINAWFFPLIISMIGLSTVLTVYIGGQEVLKGNITVGNIAEFIIYVNMLTWPVTSLGWITSIIQRAAASQERINEFLDQKNTIQSDKNRIEEINGEISFSNVRLTYPESGIKALDNVNFTIKAGETVALIGGTGSGKSTAANMICRLYDSDTGSVQIDGKDIKEYDVINLRSQIGYVPQDVFLFSDTIKNNIAFGNEEATDQEIEKAARDAYVHHNIMDFPDGYDTFVGERGVTLSGGQKQRVSIARAILKNPKILIFDDCLSAVDTKTEDVILSNLESVMKGKTSLIVSHRLSSVKLADRILVLEDGKIVEQGSHQELMKLAGVYAEMYSQQLEGTN
ncbi:MAG: ABC transporter ATP-binding protein [Cyclobacteriaceae bacterium]